MTDETTTQNTSTTLKKLPYVTSESDITDSETQQQIDWIRNGEPLTGRNPDSAPNYGNLNRVADNLQQNILTNEYNIKALNYAYITLLGIVGNFVDLSQYQEILGGYPPVITHDLPSYLTINENEIYNQDGGMLVLGADNFEDIEWIKNDVLIDPQYTISTDNGEELYPNTVATVDMEGTYVALVYNTLGVARSTECFIQVLRQYYTGLPQFTENLPLETVNFKLGGAVELKVIPSNYVSIVWKKDDELLIDQKTNVLYIESSTYSDKGEYVCELENPNGIVQSIRCNVNIVNISLPYTKSTVNLFEENNNG